MARTKKERKELTGYAFVGFLFIGFVISILMGRWDTFPYLGLGLGFIAALVVGLLAK